MFDIENVEEHDGRFRRASGDVNARQKYSFSRSKFTFVHIGASRLIVI